MGSFGFDRTKCGHNSNCDQWIQPATEQAIIHRSLGLGPGPGLGLGLGAHIWRSTLLPYYYGGGGSYYESMTTSKRLFAIIQPSLNLL